MFSKSQQYNLVGDVLRLRGTTDKVKRDRDDVVFK